jgi:hypothetical protein
MLDKSAQAGQHSYEDRQDDLYETSASAVHALLKVETIPRRVWEPACGPGSIVRVLRASGRTVLATDLHNYGQDIPPIDFLTTKLSVSDDIDCILTNPPYRLAQKFVEHALDHRVPLVVMLLRLAFLESERRTAILERSGLARIHVVRNRLPFMHRSNWDGPKASSAIPFAWFCWERGYQGPTTIDRVSWQSSS